MPRPRTPTVVLERTGALKRDRKRHAGRENEPKDARAIGDPPDFLTAEQVKAWRYVVERCPEGVLRRADEVAVATCAVLFAKLIGNPGAATPAAVAQLRGLLASFGMTPADRSRVEVPSPAKRSRLQEAMELR